MTKQLSLCKILFIVIHYSVFHPHNVIKKSNSCKDIKISNTTERIQYETIRDENILIVWSLTLK